LTCRQLVDILMATTDGLAEVASRPDARAIKGKPGYRPRRKSGAVPQL